MRTCHEPRTPVGRASQDPGPTPCVSTPTLLPSAVPAASARTTTLFRGLPRGPHARCLRFAAALTERPRKTRFPVAVLCLAGRDFHPRVTSRGFCSLHGFLLSQALPGAMGRGDARTARDPYDVLSSHRPSRIELIATTTDRRRTDRETAWCTSGSRTESSTGLAADIDSHDAPRAALRLGGAAMRRVRRRRTSCRASLAVRTAAMREVRRRGTSCSASLVAWRGALGVRTAALREVRRRGTSCSASLA